MRKPVAVVVIIGFIFSASFSANTLWSQNSTPNTSQTDLPVIRAMEMNMAEVELGKIASAKAKDSRVKDFAEMMVKDHTQALGRLRSIPGYEDSNVKPNATHQQTADRLSKLSGPEFDREYIDTMISSHQEALAFFEEQSQNKTAAASGPEDLPNVATELLSTIRHHLDMAQEIQDGLINSDTSSK